MTEDSTARLAREAVAMLKNYGGEIAVEEHFRYADDSCRDLREVTITLRREPCSA